MKNCNMILTDTLHKYKYEYPSQKIQQVQFTYFPLGEAFEEKQKNRFML